jgi:hypothetical protein
VLAASGSRSRPLLAKVLRNRSTFQEILGDRACLEASPQFDVDGLVLQEEPVRAVKEAQLLHRPHKRELLGRLEVE